MADLFLPVRNVVIEWRYPPQLRIYGKMDEIGIHFGDQFPDWVRAPLTLDIRNKEAHRRFYMAYRRAFYEVIDPANHSVAGEIDRANQLFERLRDQVGIEQIERVGFRQWAAFEKEEGFDDLVERGKPKFHPPAGTIEKHLHGDVTDVGYSAEVTTGEGWKYKITTGPMEKSQWFELVPMEKGLFKDAIAAAEYEESFPDRFLYCDIDCSLHETTPGNVKGWLARANKLTRDVFSELYHYFGDD